jgi:hypothetical protein
MDQIVDIRIVQSRDGIWGVRFGFLGGEEIVEPVGSIDAAIAKAARLRRPPLLRVIEGGLSRSARDRSAAA